MKRSLVLALVLLLTGCRTVTTQTSPALDLRAPLRTAVLPFHDVSAGDQGLAIPLGAMMDVVPLLSDDTYGKTNAAQILRRKLLANLHRTPLDLLPPLVVDKGLANAELSRSALYQPDRAALARHVADQLGVDLVVFGRVTEWDRHYVVVASWVSVGLELDVRDGRTGASLFRAELDDVETAGLHKGLIATEPAEIVVVAIGETLRGLRNTLFAELSNELTRVAVDELQRASRRKSVPARLTHAVASLEGDELTLVVLGTPGAKALAYLPGHDPVLLSETQPGVYSLSLLVQPGAAVRKPIRFELIGSETHRVWTRLDRPQEIGRGGPADEQVAQTN